MSDWQDISTEALNGWLPIDTAPKDGTAIEVYGPDPAHGKYQGPAKWIKGFPGYWGKLHRHGFFNMVAHPSHWRPIQPPRGGN